MKGYGFVKKGAKTIFAVAGAGYVGLSLATLFAQDNIVYIVDIVKEKVDLINEHVSPINDREIKEFFANKTLNLIATQSNEEAYQNADYVIVATPTNFDTTTNEFDTSNVEDVIEKVTSINPNATIVIKSTVPIGFTKNIKKKYRNNNIIFSPEFLRESKALWDNLYPSRIIVGVDKDDSRTEEKAQEFLKLLLSVAKKEGVPTLITGTKEAEAIKLFSNTYLALRIAYFNELDTYASINQLDAQDVIEGVCQDPRIGDFYNNPSFGYGGYCLPKDTKQLRASFAGVPQNLIDAICNANDTRKVYIAQDIRKRLKDIENPKDVTIGIYRLTMKTNSDNFRSSAIQGIIEILQGEGFDIIIYEPELKQNSFEGLTVCHDLTQFKNTSTIIVANRTDENLKDVREKVYTRDVYHRD